jgi:hypothetical protein
VQHFWHSSATALIHGQISPYQCTGIKQYISSTTCVQSANLPMRKCESVQCCWHLHHCAARCDCVTFVDDTTACNNPLLPSAATYAIAFHNCLAALDCDLMHPHLCLHAIRPLADHHACFRAAGVSCRCYHQSGGGHLTAGCPLRLFAGHQTCLQSVPRTPLVTQEPTAAGCVSGRDAGWWRCWRSTSQLRASCRAWSCRPSRGAAPRTSCRLWWRPTTAGTAGERAHQRAVLRADDGRQAGCNAWAVAHA